MNETNDGYEEIQIVLPDHSDELLQAQQEIEKLKNRLKITETQRSITDSSHEQMFEAIVRVLDYLGKLSVSAFDIQDELRESYLKTYIKTPELAKTLWLQHLDKIHHPYDLLKNRCYKLLGDVDILYHRKFKKHPPNWKI